MPSKVAAQTKTALSWVRLPGAEECIAASEVARRVGNVVGPVLTTADAAQVSIEGRVAPSGGEFVAHVVVTDRAGVVLGQRVLRSFDGRCRSLDESLVLVLAIAIDPNAAIAELPAEFAPGPDRGAELLEELRQNPPAPVPVAVRDAPPSAQPPLQPVEDEPGYPVEFRAAAGTGVGLGLLRAAAFGVSAEFGVAWGGWMYRARGTRWFTQHDATEIVALDAMQLDLAICPRLWGDMGWSVALCGGPAGAHMSAQPIAFGGRERAAWLFGATAGARLERALASGLFVVFDVEGRTLWPRHAVVYEEGLQVRTVYRMPAVAASSSLSLELHF